jgi:hypothetical protein
VGLNSPKTIAEVLDEIERIQQELFSLQKAVEKIEKGNSIPPQAQVNLSLRKRKPRLPPRDWPKLSCHYLHQLRHGGGGEGCIGVLLRSRNYSSRRRKSCRDFHVVPPLCGLHKSGTTGRVGKLLDDFSQRCQKGLHTPVQRKVSFRQKSESSVAL